MTSHDDSAGADLVDEAFEASSEPEDEAALEKPFQPWHRPRKHFIRLRQWCDEVKSLLLELKKKRGGTAPEKISYLTLPGDELLDIRVLHDVCGSQGVRLRYLGFNTPKGRGRILESALSQSEVQKMDHIDGPGSRVLHDPIEQVTVPKSIASGALQGEAPFDVVNLDFCASIADAPPKTKGSTLEAIKHLLDVQRTSARGPWLLFVTTRVDKDVVDAKVWDILTAVISGNIKTSRGFTAALEKIAMGDDPSVWRDDQQKFYRGFIIGLGKWMLALTTTARPHWKIELLSSYGYAVTNPMDLLSLSFRFELIVEPLCDDTGLVESSVQAQAQEHELATLMAERAGACLDVDRELSDDPHLREDMTVQTQELLATVRYSGEAYRRWLEGQPAA